MMAIELKLYPTKEFSRALLFRLTEGGKTLCMSVLSTSRVICFIVGDIRDDWYLDVKGKAIWQRGCAIDLTPSEVDSIRRMYEPHGLTIHNDLPRATPVGSESAKRANLSVSRSGGERGASPSPICTGEGALAMALISHESY